MGLKIVIPLDGSKLAEAILPHVTTLLKREGGEVTLVRAVPPPMSEGAVLILNKIMDGAETYLQPIQESFKAASIPAKSIVRLGTPARTILDVAQEQTASMIALTTHGRTGLSRWVFGSVAEKILRASDRPTLLLRSLPEHPVAASTDQPFKRILVPLDGSESSRTVVPAVLPLARAFGSRVLLLHVAEPEIAPPESLSSYMRRAAQEFSAAGIATSQLESRGEPAHEILEQCNRHAVDLLAMATHGRSGFTRWVLGSVTEKVVRAATIPMFVVRGSPEALAPVTIDTTAAHSPYFP